MALKLLFQKNRSFFIGFLVFVIASLFLLVRYSKASGFFLLNPYHSNFLDNFFIFFTNLGDGFFAVGVGVLLFFFRKRFLALMVLSSYAVSGIIAQVLKYFILEARPAVYLKDTAYSYFIENVTLHNFHAFPSGHTATAFALAGVLAFSAINKKFAMLFLALAVLVGYSRIYLGQHFIDDVLVGGIIGFLCAVYCWISFENVFSRWLQPKKIN